METLTLGHSPDPDDAFMFYGLASGRVPSGEFKFEHILEGIETLNHRAMQEELDITAVSIHAYAYLQDRYMLLPHGASMGEGYGPMVVAKKAVSVEELKTKLIAVPGTMTSAFLGLKLLLGDFKFKVVPFDHILETVRDGEADAGLVIHEGQLTFPDFGLQEIVNLGVWWADRTGGLPLPLGGNVIRRSFGKEKITRVSAILRDSIQFGLDNRKEAVDHALKYARGMTTELADEFVGMYVNDRTVDYGDTGRKAVRLFLEEGFDRGLIPGPVHLEFSA